MTDELYEEIELAISLAKEEMQQALDHLGSELKNIRAGKASPGMLKEVYVEYYGNPTPLNQVANISIQDSRTLMIQAWEKKTLPQIEKAIFEANLGVTPQNDGEFVRISIPPLTEERRKDLVKKAKALGEDAKVSMRNTRKKIMNTLKEATKKGYPEDAEKRKEGKIQEHITDLGKKVDEMIKAKENDILTI